MPSFPLIGPATGEIFSGNASYGDNGGNDMLGVLPVISTIAGIGQSVANYINQAEMQKYQKELQKTMFNREDTAVQRRVADLNAAGLSPTLAAGSAAQSGPAVSVGTPQHGDYAQQIQKALGVTAVSLDLKAKQAEIDRTHALTRLTEIQADRQKQGFEFETEMNPLKLAEKRMGNDLTFRTLDMRVTELQNKLSLQELQKLNYEADTVLKKAQTSNQLSSAYRNSRYGDTIGTFAQASMINAESYESFVETQRNKWFGGDGFKGEAEKLAADLAIKTELLDRLKFENTAGRTVDFGSDILGFLLKLRRATAVYGN